MVGAGPRRSRGGRLAGMLGGGGAPPPGQRRHPGGTQEAVSRAGGTGHAPGHDGRQRHRRRRGIRVRGGAAELPVGGGRAVAAGRRTGAAALSGNSGGEGGGDGASG
eukprot:3866735-Pleurochrysis_carterae.AAC.1